MSDNTITTFFFEERNSIQILQIESLLSDYDNRLILKEVEEKINDGFSHFVIDLSRADFMNSVGLSFLITVRSRSQESGGDLFVVNPSPKVMDLFEMTKLNSIFRLAGSVEEALNSFTTPS